MQNQDYINLIIAVVIGIAVGIEREHEKIEKQKANVHSFGGARTFPLVSLLGFLAVYFYQKQIVWVLPLAMFSVAALLIISNYKDSESYGLTSEMAFLVTFLLGALCAIGEVYASAFIMVITAAILSAKPIVRKWIQRLTEQELITATKFALISLVVLPLLPRELPIPKSFTASWPNLPYKLLNPYEVWLVVVLVCAIGFFGYILNRILGSRRGILVTAFAGGLVSSTPVTMDYAKRANASSHPRYLGMGIILACLLMFPRMILETWIFHSPLAHALLWPLLGIFFGGLLYLLFLFWLDSARSTEEAQVNIENPMSLKDGMIFAGLYLVISLFAWLGQQYLGDWGLYAVGIVSGITDVDAITISMAKSLEMNSPGVTLKSAAYTVYLAGASNTLTKGILVFVLAPRSFSKIVFPGFLWMLTLGFVFLFTLL